MKKKPKRIKTPEDIERWKKYQEQDLRQSIRKLVSSVASIQGVEQKEIWRLLKSYFQNSQTTADIRELKERREFLTKLEDKLTSTLMQQEFYAYKDAHGPDGFDEEEFIERRKEVRLPPIEDNPAFCELVGCLKKRNFIQ
jgi:hypothetical protein